ncbi:protein kinase, ATP binding site-containing protein [Tanacetum coccineum]|uniref:Protein kinase, ATP binding site-containing protein n=1 Tax=Tanacetum coccineum TaxID=301880 RepID=A0ABQ4XHD1_9ASTR
MSPSEVNLEKLRIPPEEIHCAAHGGFKPDGVYRYTGHLSRQDHDVIMIPEVDVKSRWSSECDGTFKSGFLYSDELQILSRCHHKNILPFIGYCDEEDIFFQHGVDGDKVILVYEHRFFDRSLAEYLQDKAKLSHLRWAHRLEICIGLAEGLNYLHSGVEGVGRVIHNDMQSKNIVIDDLKKPRIMGFYHSVIVPENRLHAQINFDVHPVDIPDPICHEIGLLDTTTDVYSYGILMFELLIGMVAYEEKVIGDNYKPRRLINIVRHYYDSKPWQLIDPALRDHIDPRSFHMFIDIAYRCISFNLKDRPTMDEIVKTIEEALEIHNRLAPRQIAKVNLEPKERFQIPLEEINKATNYFHKPSEIEYSSCFYRGYLYDRWKRGPVAIKKCKVSSFQDELALVSRLRHGNIIRFIGYCTEAGENILVYECADKGSLSTNLHSLTWAQRLKICIGAAKGLKYLHSGIGEYESVIHGEFSSQNILISDNLEAKMCGLGSSFLVPRYHLDTKVYKSVVGSREMDPVYRESYIPNVEANVYSLGVVLFEILTGKSVYTKCNGDEDLILMALARRHYGSGFDTFIDPQIRDEIDVRSLHICKEIAYRCISYNIKDRPSLNKIITRLDEALQIQNHRAPSTVTEGSLQYQKLEDFLIPLKDIDLAIGVKGPETRIGDGGFGVVYKGQPLERWQNRTVAIKCLHPESYQGEYEFRNELNMIFRFSHKNIIPFIGYCDEGKEKIIVYEYASNGSLDCHLNDKEKRRFLTWEHRLKICLGAARGLEYLHSGLGEDKRVIHRDVKSANILLDHNLVAKVCDFGLSKSGPINQQHTQVYTNAAGTNFYMDPVYHESGVLRKESDVYSFGVVMFELLSGMLAYKRRSFGDGKPKPLINLVRRYYDYRPDLLVDPLIKDEIDSRSFNIFREVAFQCISFNSNERPTMEAIGDRVKEALELHDGINLNDKVDDFIKRFEHDLRLQRLDSLARHKQMIDSYKA